MTVLFLVIAAVILGSALLVVTARNLVHAALWLVVTLFGVAMLYAVLNAGFLAVVQVVVYIGAIAILFIFAVMLTRREVRERGPGLNRNWPAAAILAAVTLAGLLWLVLSWPGASTQAASLPGGFDAVGELGLALVSPDAYVLPFEVASVLLVTALVGSVYIAFNRK